MKDIHINQFAILYIIDQEAMLMLVLSIILLLLGLILIGISRFVAYQRDIDLREKIYIPGVIFVLIGALLLLFDLIKQPQLNTYTLSSSGTPASNGYLFFYYPHEIMLFSPTFLPKCCIFQRHKTFNGTEQGYNLLHYQM